MCVEVGTDLDKATEHSPVEFFFNTLKMWSTESSILKVLSLFTLLQILIYPAL